MTKPIDRDSSLVILLALAKSTVSTASLKETRSTFLALLSQREDMSEEEANQIADQVESTYKSLTEQIQKVKQTFQSTIDNIFGNYRTAPGGRTRSKIEFKYSI